MLSFLQMSSIIHQNVKNTKTKTYLNPAPLKCVDIPKAAKQNPPKKLQNNEDGQRD